ncbi:hypothetical protein [Fontivita pretiosa]|uniref:hypothetical protein n=1 Tax=Fontivita pretiosa TaxID=2989684 RepID=UPI003D16FFC0
MAATRVRTQNIGDAEVRTADIQDGAVTYAKIQDVSATDRLLGRQSAGAGNVEEIVCTAAGRALLDDPDAAAQRTTLGLGTIATQSANNVVITGGSIAGIADLALADGGTGASLVDPNDDRMLFWDESAGSVAFLDNGNGLVISGTTISAQVQIPILPDAGGIGLRYDNDSIKLDGSNQIELRKFRDESSDPGSPAEGEVWNHTTDKLFKGRSVFGNATFVTNIFEGVGDGSGVDLVGASTTSEVTFTRSGVNVSYTIAANSLQAGQVFRITVFGRFNTGTATSVRLRVRLGGTGGAVIWDSDSFNPFSTSGAQSNIPFGCIAMFRIQTVGTGGTGRSGCYGFVGAALTPTLGVQSFNTTTALTVTVTIQYGASHANNLAFINQFTIEPMGNNP